MDLAVEAFPPPDTDDGAPARDAAIYALAARLYPICRSITGQGVLDTLDILSAYMDLDVTRVPSGTRIFDWTVPPEWIVRSARLKDPYGRTIVDFANHNLHLLNYSMPMQARMPLCDLKPHLHTLPEQPDLIPYKTAYYTDAWGFCMRHDQFMALEDGEYEVCIDTEKVPGHLTYGEYLHRGQVEEEVLLYAHICHPSLANDNCSGVALLACLAQSMRSKSTHYSYRFVFGPGTIGSLAWLQQNEERLGRIKHGLVLSCVGDGGGPNYKRSRQGRATVDRAAACVRCGADSVSPLLSDFIPYGYDERQFCSPGFDLPVGLLQRSAFGTFPQYHTSADDLDFIRPEHIGSSFRMVEDILHVLENNWTPLNLSPKGEPQLGRHGLLSMIGGHKTNSDRVMAYLWVLNLADGGNSLLDISERARMPFSEISAAAAMLNTVGLVKNLGFVRQ
jgi:aminopeptidase-like protein